MGKRFGTPDEVEQAFYRAVQNKDIHAMSDVWMDSDAIACIHPMGSRLQGRQEVMASWQQIFSGEKDLIFEPRDVRRQRSATLAVHLLHEYIVTDKKPGKVTITEATNVYAYNEAAGWLMLLHHASLSPKTVVERRFDKGLQQGALH